jgi:hypothetical protein
MRGPARLIVFSAVTAALTLLPSAAQASNDPSFVAQWSLRKMGATAAWERTTGAGVRIGIVDTDLTHETQGYTPLEAINRLLRTTEPVGCPTASPTCQGRIDLDKATGE